jgi:hypothetical protein
VTWWIFDKNVVRITSYLRDLTGFPLAIHSAAAICPLVWKRPLRKIAGKSRQNGGRGKGISLAPVTVAVNRGNTEQLEKTTDIENEQVIVGAEDSMLIYKNKKTGDINVSPPYGSVEIHSFTYS